MADAPKVLVVVDYVTQMTRVYTNQHNLMVEVTELSEDEPDFERDTELFQREYPYLQFGEEPEEEDDV
jgi:hypothetical protein